jgi:Sulfotransferase family
MHGDPDPESATVGASSKVVFIGGYGRSGSTLLDRVLGSIDGFVSAGELRHVWREGYLENRLCGCGEPFLSCPFWARVTARAFGDAGALDVERVLALKERVDRYWRIPQIVTGVARRELRDGLRWYAACLRSLYEAIAAESGASVIVDSSKDVSHGYVLDSIEPPLDLRILHLVRDSRAVAYSWQRTRFNPGSGRDMERFSVTRASFEWVAINAVTALQRRVGPAKYARLRYEDFVGDPRRTLARILAFLDERGRDVPVDEQGRIELTPSHTAAGNPMRFTSGSMMIRSDDEWRAQMPSTSRRVVTALTLPVLATAARSTI